MLGLGCLGVLHPAAFHLELRNSSNFGIGYPKQTTESTKQETNKLSKRLTNQKQINKPNQPTNQTKTHHLSTQIGLPAGVSNQDTLDPKRGAK